MNNVSFKASNAEKFVKYLHAETLEAKKTKVIKTEDIEVFSEGANVNPKSKNSKRTS